MKTIELMKIKKMIDALNMLKHIFLIVFTVSKFFDEFIGKMLIDVIH